LNFDRKGLTKEEGKGKGGEEDMIPHAPLSNEKSGNKGALREVKHDCATLAAVFLRRKTKKRTREEITNIQ